MSLVIRPYQASDLEEMTAIWNAVVEKGDAFPQKDPLSLQEAASFFASQTHTGVAVDMGEVVGLYILHPNNVGRCGHIANASYAVKETVRGRHIGEALVRHSMDEGWRHGFTLLQFNAVVATNTGAIHLYQKIGFTQLGTIPGGFLMPDGHYEDIIPFVISLV